MKKGTNREKSVQGIERAEDRRRGDECDCRLRNKIGGTGDLFI
jgi:hypothetical protein